MALTVTFSRSYDQSMIPMPMEQLKEIIIAELALAVEYRGFSRIHVHHEKDDWAIDPIQRLGRLRNDTFYLLLDCVPKVHDHTRDMFTLPETLWGVSTHYIALERREIVGMANTEGIKIYAPETTVPVATLSQQWVFTHLVAHNRIHRDENQRDREQLLSHLFGEISSSMIDSNQPTFEEVMAQSYAAPNDALVALLKVRSKRALAELPKALARYSSLKSELQNVAATDVDTSCLDEVAKLPEIKSVVAQDGLLCLSTHTMYYKSQSGRLVYEFGEFDIRMRFGRIGEYPVSCHNTTHRVSYGCHPFGHPHVDRGCDRLWCQGEGYEIKGYLREYEIVLSVLYVLQAIQSVNESDHRGDYSQVLAKFPHMEVAEWETKGLPQYPDTTCEITDECRSNMAAILDHTRGTAIRQLNTELSMLRMSIQTMMSTIAKASFFDTLLKHAERPLDLQALIAGRVEQLTELPMVTQSGTEGSDVFFETEGLAVTDVGSGRQAVTSPLRFTCSPLTGGIRVFRTGETEAEGVLDVTSVLDDAGNLPVGEASIAVPELLGSFELPVVASLAMQSLQRLDVP